MGSPWLAPAFGQPIRGTFRVSKNEKAPDFIGGRAM